MSRHFTSACVLVVFGMLVFPVACGGSSGDDDSVVSYGGHTGTSGATGSSGATTTSSGGVSTSSSGGANSAGTTSTSNSGGQNGGGASATGGRTGNNAGGRTAAGGSNAGGGLARGGSTSTVDCGSAVAGDMCTGGPGACPGVPQCSCNMQGIVTGFGCHRDTGAAGAGGAAGPGGPGGTVECGTEPARGDTCTGVGACPGVQGCYCGPQGTVVGNNCGTGTGAAGAGNGGPGGTVECGSAPVSGDTCTGQGICPGVQGCFCAQGRVTGRNCTAANGGAAN